MIYLYYAHFPHLDPVEPTIRLLIHTHVMPLTVETLLSSAGQQVDQEEGGQGPTAMPVQRPQGKHNFWCDENWFP